MESINIQTFALNCEPWEGLGFKLESEAKDMANFCETVYTFSCDHNRSFVDKPRFCDHCGAERWFRKETCFKKQDAKSKLCLVFVCKGSQFFLFHKDDSGPSVDLVGALTRKGQLQMVMQKLGLKGKYQILRV